MAERDSEAITLEEVVAYLNTVQMRATYDAVAQVVGGIARSIGHRLGGSWGKRPEASWVVNAKTGMPTDYRLEQLHASLLRTTEVISSGQQLRRRLTEWKAAGRPVRPKESRGAAPTTPRPRAAAPQPPSLSVHELAALGRRLTAMLNAFEPRAGGPSDGTRERIERLSQPGGPIPRHIAALMVTITEMRTTTEQGSTVLSASECAVVRHAWQAILGWAHARPGKTS